MSAQMIELLIFAGIAFFIISRLIAMLGSTSDDDPAKRSSYFGEPNLKDVTDTDRNSNSTPVNNQLEQAKVPIKTEELQGIIVEGNSSSIVNGLEILRSRLKSFKPSNFVRNSKMAFKMIIEYGNNKDKEALAQLVDKRYLEQFQSVAEDYGSFLNLDNLIAKISEIYMFGNNVFIKILFSGKNITSKKKTLQEEWTFTKSLITQDLDWFLTNIDQL